MGKRGPQKGSPYKYTKTFIEKEADALLQYAQSCEMIPFLYEFAPSRGYDDGYLTKWAKINTKLSHALKKFKNLQLHKLLILSLAKKVDNVTTIFILKNVHNWSDRQAIEHSGEVKGTDTKIVIIRPDGKPDTEDERIQSKTEAISR